LSKARDMNKDLSSNVPAKGEWPVEPQEDIEISKDRIWVDGCFDFSHHGTPDRDFVRTRS